VRSPVETFYAGLGDSAKALTSMRVRASDQIPADWKDDYVVTTNDKGEPCYPPGKDAILIPNSRKVADSAIILERLKASGIRFTQVKSNILDFMGYFFIENLPDSFKSKLQLMSEVSFSIVSGPVHDSVRISCLVSDR
jgi:hypothetical protein